MRITDGLRDALLVVWNYVYSDGWPIAAQGDAEKALREAFYQADTIDRHTHSNAAYFAAGLVFGVALCVISWLVGGSK